MYFFKRSAKQDCLESELILGTIYRDEKHKPQNLNKSIKYFLLAEKHNNHLAQYYLGIIYFRFPYNDLTKAVHFLTLSAKNNNPHLNYFSEIFICLKSGIYLIWKRQYITFNLLLIKI